MGAALFIVVVGCQAHIPPTTATFDGMLEQGKWRAASEYAALALRDETRPLSLRLRAIRIWILGLARRGRLSEARRWALRRGAYVKSEALYAQALTEIADNPANLPHSIELLMQAAKIEPTQGEFHFRAGLFLLADETPRLAYEHLERACDLERSAACLVTMAHALLDLNRPTAALARVREIMTLRPRPIDIRRGRHLIRRLERRRPIPDDVRLQYEQLIDTDIPSARRAKRLRKLIERLPTFAAAHTLMGLTQLNLFNLDGALASFQRAAELDVNDAKNPAHIGTIYRERGDLKRALKFFKHALTLDPFARWTAKNLVKIHQKLNHDEKVRYFQDYLRQLEQAAQAGTALMNSERIRPKRR